MCFPGMVGAVSTDSVSTSRISYTELSRKHDGAFPLTNTRQLIANRGRSAKSSFRVSMLSLLLSTW